jgi:hypothetical protein
MKKTFISVGLALLMVCACAQEKKVTVPEAVKKAFAAQFPNATKVEWGLEKPGEFEAEFKLNNVEMSANIDEKGTLLETETEIKESDLPQAVKSTLAKDFAGYKIEEILKADAKGIITFEMTAQKDKKEFVLEFDINGKLLKQAEEKEEDEKN